MSPSGRLRSAYLDHLALQPLIECPPVRQAGERIGLGKAFHAIEVFQRL